MVKVVKKIIPNQLNKIIFLFGLYFLGICELMTNLKLTHEKNGVVKKDNSVAVKLKKPIPF